MPKSSWPIPPTPLLTPPLPLPNFEKLVAEIVPPFVTTPLYDGTAHSLLICGPVGSGRTWLANAVSFAVAQKLALRQVWVAPKFASEVQAVGVVTVIDDADPAHVGVLAEALARRCLSTEPGLLIVVAETDLSTHFDVAVALSARSAR